MIIAAHQRLFILLTIFLVSLQVQGSIHQSLPKQQAKVDFYIDTQSEYDEKLISRLERFSVFDKLRSFSEQDLHLKHKVVYHFVSPVKDFSTLPQDITTDTETRLDIRIPFSYLYQLDQGLLTKYPQQPEVLEAIYSVAVEKFLWFELGKALMDQFELGFSGKEVFALDNFSTLMLVNLNQQENDYILDATEAFLLLEQSIPYLKQNDYDAEISLDEQRYRKAVCLILGKDYLAQLDQSQQAYQQLLEDLAWDQEKIELCKKLYLEKLRTWLEALHPHLREENRLTNWLAVN